MEARPLGGDQISRQHARRRISSISYFQLFPTLLAGRFSPPTGRKFRIIIRTSTIASLFCDSCTCLPCLVCADVPNLDSVDTPTIQRISLSSIISQRVYEIQFLAEVNVSTAAAAACAPQGGRCMRRLHPSVSVHMSPRFRGITRASLLQSPGLPKSY